MLPSPPGTVQPACKVRGFFQRKFTCLRVDLTSGLKHSIADFDGDISKMTLQAGCTVPLLLTSTNIATSLTTGHRCCCRWQRSSRHRRRTPRRCLRRLRRPSPGCRSRRVSWCARPGNSSRMYLGPLLILLDLREFCGGAAFSHSSFVGKVTLATLTLTLSVVALTSS